MKELAKYSGVIVMIIGVLILALPFFSGTTNNTNLLIGLVLIVEGFFLGNYSPGCSLFSFHGNEKSGIQQR